MSFGERAPVEGVLAQLRPRLALEIGTAEGGSLARIASYSAEVHSIDLSRAELAAEVPGNVRLHTGPSDRVLPPLLEGFCASSRLLDFALVDGDHSFDGVRTDLRLLLGSPCTARSVILVHDSTNAEVGPGSRAPGLSIMKRSSTSNPTSSPATSTALAPRATTRGAGWR
jgi:cephalosporin hydroxylase